eukprot:SAG11_NODE_3261_length_2571_cov_8.876214_2_plen_81_part_00
MLCQVCFVPALRYSWDSANLFEWRTARFLSDLSEGWGSAAQIQGMHNPSARPTIGGVFSEVLHTEGVRSFWKVQYAGPSP